MNAAAPIPAAKNSFCLTSGFILFGLTGNQRMICAFYKDVYDLIDPQTHVTLSRLTAGPMSQTCRKRRQCQILQDKILEHELLKSN